MATKTTNFNAMRPVIITAHKAGNRKPITKDMVQGADVDIAYFTDWCRDCNSLRKTLESYVQKKFAKKYGYELDGKKVTDDDLFAAKELIFPKWKEILQVGESSKTEKELHVDVDDVEDLIGFVWEFMDSGKGTVQTIVSEQIFRKKVESMLGCAIAKNAVLNDNDRDAISNFRSAEKRVQKAIDDIAELETQKKGYELKLQGLSDTEVSFKEFLENMLTDCDTQIKAKEEAKANAEADVAKYTADAKAVLNRIRYAK